MDSQTDRNPRMCFLAFNRYPFYLIWNLPILYLDLLLEDKLRLTISGLILKYVSKNKRKNARVRW